MSFDIPKAQQKVFIEHFMKQVLDVALGLADAGKVGASPGETIYKVGQGVIAQLYEMREADGDEPPTH